MAPESTIEQAEARVAQVQAALDEAQQVLQVADNAQKKAEQAAERLRQVNIGLAIGGTVIVALLLLRHHSLRSRLR